MLVRTSRILKTCECGRCCRLQVRLDVVVRTFSNKHVVQDPDGCLSSIITHFLGVHILQTTVVCRWWLLLQALVPQIEDAFTATFY
jgi:hypothetical protein